MSVLYAMVRKVPAVASRLRADATARRAPRTIQTRQTWLSYGTSAAGQSLVSRTLHVLLGEHCNSIRIDSWRSSYRPLP
jgi:hypothetical protein